MNFMIFIAAFLMAADENTFTRTLHRPLAACTIFGAVLGNAPAGLAAGAVLELGAITFDQLYSTNYILPSLAAAVLAVNGTSATESAAAAAAFFGISYLLKEITGLINTVFLPAARKGAQNRKESGLLVPLLLSLIITGAVYGACAMILASYGSDIVNGLVTLTSSYGWIAGGLHAAGVLVSAVGIAILLRNLNAKQIPGAYLAGFGLAAAFLSANRGWPVLLICGMIAFGISAMDYHIRSESGAQTNETKKIEKGGKEWW